ncbi:O-methyltransferase COMT-type, S-adenosyl-L-methionine-dependent methyltransferase [Artemisia annua]|uniref:O-methyltransferase COMT-type, S-adenosyl-L-methionine-dependent methyltransferase n=1 Tax=Artemisia annua TaxID=35608 RepID=A0A2U1NQT9_ARTAN|nr:O-methyltransferase COMT-type, S-adenosyl-L-methionine-dependent methyltransferase [Artemisia annua]
MALQNGNSEHYSSDHIVHTQAHVWNHIFSFVNSMSLKCAIQLEIPDIIHNHGSAMTLSELVKALPISSEKSQFVYRLMRILVHSGFFTIKSISKTENGEKEGYLLTNASHLLLKQEPLSMRPFLLAMLDPVLIEPYHFLGTWFKSDDINPFETAHGSTLWEYAGHEQKLNQFFNDAMASDAALVSNVILKNCPHVFEGLNSIVDVGGGTGTLAKGIAKAFPSVNCINFDLAHVIDGLEGSSNLINVGGDMFKGIPKADAVLMKWILHDWNDEECIKILKRCKEAIPSKKNGGKLIIIDMVVNQSEKDYKFLETKLFWDIEMMVQVKGKERSEKEWAQLFVDAGFSEYKITPVVGLRSLIEVYP